MEILNSTITVTKVLLLILLFIVILGEAFFDRTLNNTQTYISILFVFIIASTLFISFRKLTKQCILIFILGIIFVILMYLNNLVILQMAGILTTLYITLLSICIYIQRYNKNTYE